MDRYFTASQNREPVTKTQASVECIRGQQEGFILESYVKRIYLFEMAMRYFVDITM